MDEKLGPTSPSQPASPSQGGPAQESASYSRDRSPLSNLFGKFTGLFSNRTTAIAGVLVLVLGLGAATIAVQRSTEIRQRAWYVITPTPACRPRPACLDTTPRCLIAETSDMCPPSRRTPTPPPSVIRNGRLFSQGGGWVSAVDSAAKTATVSYPQPASACSPNFCPKGRPPDVLRQGEVLVINSLDSVENDITQMKVGDRLTVFFLQPSGNNTFQPNVNTIPYAVKDFNLLPPNCDPVTKICSGSINVTPGGSTIPRGNTAPNK